MDKELQELNEKLAKFAEMEHDFISLDLMFPMEICENCRCAYKDGRQINGPSDCIPDFTSSLDAQVKWLWPKLLERNLYIGIGAEINGYECWIFEGEPIEGDPFQEYEVKVLEGTPALAAARAIEQVIDG